MTALIVTALGCLLGGFLLGAVVGMGWTARNVHRVLSAFTVEQFKAVMDRVTIPARKP